MTKYEADTQITIKGYAIEVERQNGYMSIRTEGGYGSDYVLPDNYVCITFHDDNGNECYAFVPGHDEDECEDCGEFIDDCLCDEDEED